MMPVCLSVSVAWQRRSQQKAVHTQSIVMMSGEFGKVERATVRELDSKAQRGCAVMCGLCAPCVFAPHAPGSPQRPWTTSDGFVRRFVLDLLLRCGNARVLESLRNALGVTSWSLSSYARSRAPARQRLPRRGASPALDAKPVGMETSKIREWFGGSPAWIQSLYLRRILSRCDPELLRTVFNLTCVLLIRQKRGFLQFNVNSHSTNQPNEDTDEDSEDPALMVVPGSSRSVSGVSRYRDFIGRLPVSLSKRILGLLEASTLRSCQKVCRAWRLLATETMEETQFRTNFQTQIHLMMTRFKPRNVVDATYANFVEVPIPTGNEETESIHPSISQVSPFEAAYVNIKTQKVQMEERNVYCGPYFTKVLLNKEDHHRVVDYRGGRLMAAGSRDRLVQLFHVGSETRPLAAMKGHVASVRAVLLNRDGNLLVTGSADASIRCWNLRTDSCEAVLYGHTGAVTCLDVHADRLVSGAKDCRVKVWNLNKGKPLEGFYFKHPASVRCVRTSLATVYSSCDRGLVKIWDMETASLIRVINGHQSSVRCLFLDEWHLLSGDVSGQVMAWSTCSQAKECLMTFSHPKEVRSLALVYLRVVTGCVDGVVRIFHFLTGGCLRHIRPEGKPGRLLSLHFNENSILLNTTSSVKLYQFSKVFWEYPGATACGQGGEMTPRAPCGSARANNMAKIVLPSRGVGNRDTKRTGFLSAPTKREKADEASDPLVLLSAKATSAWIKRRGPHHPLTRDRLLLRVGALQRTGSADEVSLNMEHNARLRDAWGPPMPRGPPRPPKRSPPNQLHRGAGTCGPRAAGQNASSPVGQRDVTTGPPATRQPCPCLSTTRAQPYRTGPSLGGIFFPTPEEEQGCRIKPGSSLPDIAAPGLIQKSKYGKTTQISEPSCAGRIRKSHVPQ